MTDFTPEQIEIIREAVGKGREAIRQSEKYDPLTFAKAFIGHGGIQIPGEPGNDRRRQWVAEQLIASLERGELTTDDRTVAREVSRAQTEARWTAAAESDKVVGFHLSLSAQSRANPACLATVNQDYGLGAAVIPKARIVVLPAVCDGSSFDVILEDEVEQ